MATPEGGEEATIASAAKQFVYFDENLDKFCVDEEACCMLDALDEQIGT